MSFLKANCLSRREMEGADRMDYADRLARRRKSELKMSKALAAADGVFKNALAREFGSGNSGHWYLRGFTGVGRARMLAVLWVIVSRLEWWWA